MVVTKQQPDRVAADQLIEILLVEDNPTDAELALHALQRHNPVSYTHLTLPTIYSV